MRLRRKAVWHRTFAAVRIAVHGIFVSDYWGLKRRLARVDPSVRGPSTPLNRHNADLR